MDLPENKVRELIQRDERPKWIAHSNHSIKCFTEREIEIMTNNYRSIIGRGGFGEVYEGVLEDKSMVAVKRFTRNANENFAKELTVHSEINHKNVVRLIGYCIEENALMIVTEYVTNGNLSNVLHHGNMPIPLDIRLKIATECAESLAYMHSQMYTQVIHGDIKPDNILLDASFNAKISDFGISRLVNTDKTLYTERVTGTIGYMDPLYAQDGYLTAKSDVYSFGVVLLELITGRKAKTKDGKISIVYIFTQALAKGIRGVREMFDAGIASQKNMKTIEEIAKLAGECLRMDRDRRPEMIDVAERLRLLRKDSQQGQQKLDLFSWVRKSKPAAPAVKIIPINKTLPSNLFRQFSIKEIKSATNNFDESLLLGVDEFSGVYSGEIDGGATKVAIKRAISVKLRRYIEDVLPTLLEMLPKLCHHHLVSLIGYCKENNDMILVYDYMAHGSLRQHLYKTQKTPLTWRQRLEICIGAARGLHYLHTGTEHVVVHGGVKTTNILLDENWVAKVSDIGVSVARLSMDCRPVSTMVMGISGYLDAESYLTQKFTEKSDVYSFGVVLLEVLCARPVIDMTLPEGQQNLVRWALCCKDMGELDQIGDPYLKGKIDPQCLNKFAETAEMCVVELGINRPSMGDVLSNLEYAFQLQESAEVSGSLGRSPPPEMLEVAEQLRTLRKAQYQRQERLGGLKSWGRKNKPAAPAVKIIPISKTLPSNLFRHFSIKEIKSATNNFDESLLLGVDEFSGVYNGEIDEGATKVAIKRVISVKLRRYIDDVLPTLLEMLPKLCHRHLVSLIGYCKENNDMILVYDYMAHGSLRQHLYKTQKTPLTWRQRLEICIGAARGLHYLHTATEHAVVHGGVKTTNILLDEKWVAKVSDIGVSVARLSMDCRPESTMVMGISGYFDAESYMTQKFTEKSDVYSFGVVLLEVLCARPVIDMTLPERQLHLVRWALCCRDMGELDQICDPYLKGKIDPQCLNKFAETAEMCVAESGIDRPSMGDVLSNLECAFQLQLSAELSGSLGRSPPPGS